MTWSWLLNSSHNFAKTASRESVKVVLGRCRQIKSSVPTLFCMCILFPLVVCLLPQLDTLNPYAFLKLVCMILASRMCCMLLRWMFDTVLLVNKSGTLTSRYMVNLSINLKFVTFLLVPPWMFVTPTLPQSVECKLLRMLPATATRSTATDRTPPRSSLRVCLLPQLTSLNL